MIPVVDTVGSHSDCEEPLVEQISPDKTFLEKLIDENSSSQYQDDDIGRLLSATVRSERGSDPL